MVGGDEALLRQEVVELTSFVQRDPEWAELRAAIVSKGLRIDDVFMAGFWERVADIDTFTESFPAVATALRMATGPR